jgi:hypothetical protein
MTVAPFTGKSDTCKIGLHFCSFDGGIGVGAAMDRIHSLSFAQE